MRNKIIFHFLAFVGVAFVYGCNVEKNEQTTNINNVIFKEYIETFNLKIPKEKFNFILIKNGCQGAIATVLMDLNNELKGTQCSFLIITSNNKMVSKFIDQDIEKVIDNTQKLDLINLPISNVSIITTENYKINKILSSSSCEQNIINSIILQLNNC